MRSHFYKIALAVIFLFLVCCNFDSLLTPPFWDDIIGVHTQAVWLKQNNFNIFSLSQMPLEPGSPRYILVNPLPYFYAMCYCFLPPAAVHFAGHIINLASAAGCCILLLKLLHGPRNKENFLVVGAALSSPLIVAGCASMGQETPLAFLILLSLYYHRYRLKKAAWFTALAGCCFKLTAIVLIFSYGVENIFNQIRNRIALWKTGLVCLAFALCTGAYFWHFSHLANHFKWKPQELISLFCNAYNLLLPLLFISIFLLKNTQRRQFSSVILFLLFYYVANGISSMPSLPRYGIIIVFPTFYLFSAALKKYSIRWQRIVWIGIILFQLCNIYGGFLPVPPRFQIHEGSFLERSREFTLMREEDQLFCRLLEKDFSQTPLVVPWPFLHMLTVPEFGYVQKPLKEVYAGEYFHHLKNVKKMTKETLKKNPVFLYAPDCFNWKIPQQAEFVFVSNREDPTAGYILYRLRFNFSNNRSIR